LQNTVSARSQKHQVCEAGGAIQDTVTLITASSYETTPGQWTTWVTLAKKWVKEFFRTLKSWKPVIKDDWMSARWWTIAA